MVEDACVVIPTLNEADSIGDLVGFFNFNSIPCFVIDDNSTDDTRGIAVENNAFVVHNEHRKGLNHCLWQGFDLAIKHQFDYVITIDAGKSHDPNQAFAMLKLMDNADLLIGSRFLPFSEYDNTKGKFYRPLFSRIAAKLCSLAQHRANYSDWTSGYRVYRTTLLQSLKKFKYNSRMHPIQIELLGRATQLGATVKEYPITYVAGKTSFNWSVANEAFKIWLQVLNHYPAKPKVIEGELL